MASYPKRNTYFKRSFMCGTCHLGYKLIEEAKHMAMHADNRRGFGAKGKGQRLFQDIMRERLAM